MEGSGKPEHPEPSSSSRGPDFDFSAPPRHTAEQPQSQPRRTAQNLPPPTIFLLIIGLFGLFVAFTSWQKEQQKKDPVVYSTSSATVHQVVPPSEEPTTATVVVQTVVQTVTVEATKTKTLTEKIVQPTRAVSKSQGDIKKDQKSESKTQQLSIMSSTEQTFIAIKPDGVQRGLVGPIISRFENRGFKLVAIKLMSPSKDHLEAHYADLKEKPFFPGLISYMLSGPICAMVWEGRDAVKTGRTILGATNPLASAPGTIRGDYAIDVGRNVCHGSDSVENAKKEIALWFKDDDVISWKSAQFDWVYEKA